MEENEKNDELKIQNARIKKFLIKYIILLIAVLIFAGLIVKTLSEILVIGLIITDFKLLKVFSAEKILFVFQIFKIILFAIIYYFGIKISIETIIKTNKLKSEDENKVLIIMNIVPFIFFIIQQCAILLILYRAQLGDINKIMLMPILSSTILLVSIILIQKHCIHKQFIIKEPNK